jgi:N utilization substance protein A
MASEMMEALRMLCQEKHIDELYLLDRLEESLAASYAQLMHMPFGAKVTIDRKSGNIYVYELEPVGEPDENGDFTEFEEVDVTPKDASRIAARHAKDEIIQIVRNAAKRDIYEEFKDAKDEIITGTVLQTTPDFTILKIREGVEAELPHFDMKKKNPDNDDVNWRNERPQGERYVHNQRVKALIVDVRDPAVAEAKGNRAEANRPTLVVSRTHPDLIKRLFELEVPEVYDGIVEIKSVAREPGVRSKIAVWSNDPHLDPVGACVGPKGTRVRSVVGELRGERVDVVLWSENPEVCIANALSPARVLRVLVDPEENRATVIVPDDQLSLAIGKAGQNARLAARLTGYHIDIKNESLARELVRRAAAARARVQAAEDDLLDEEEALENREEELAEVASELEAVASAYDVEDDDVDSLI